MPEPRWEQKKAETKIEMPPDLLDKSPEDMIKEMEKLAGRAVEGGLEVLTDLKQLDKELPDNSPHKAKAQKLANETTQATEQLKTDLAKEGVQVEETPEEEEGWTPDRIAKLKAKTEARRGAEERQERLKVLGKLRADLVSRDQEFKASLGEFNPENITGQQENKINSMEKTMQDAFKKAELNDAEKAQIKFQLSNFVEAKRALINFHLKRENTALKRLIKGYQEGTIQGEVDPTTRKVGPPKRIKMLKLKRDQLKEELKQYDIAA